MKYVSFFWWYVIELFFQVGEHSDSDIIGKGKGDIQVLVQSSHHSPSNLVNNKIQLYTLLQAISQPLDSSWLNSIVREKESL